MCILLADQPLGEVRQLGCHQVIAVVDRGRSGWGEDPPDRILVRFFAMTHTDSLIQMRPGRRRVRIYAYTCQW